MVAESRIVCTVHLIDIKVVVSGGVVYLLNIGAKLKYIFLCSLNLFIRKQVLYIYHAYAIVCIKGCKLLVRGF